MPVLVSTVDADAADGDHLGDRADLQRDVEPNVLVHANGDVGVPRRLEPASSATHGVAADRQPAQNVRPASLLTAVVSAFVASWVALTVTPGMTPPAGVTDHARDAARRRLRADGRREDRDKQNLHCREGD